jgi:Ser/Thr protein kinase RdoA (MazF antagonist)
MERGAEYLEGLAAFVQREYGLKALQTSPRIAPAKRGYYGETWRLDAESGRFFLKLVDHSTQSAVYEASFPVMEHLCEHGIDFISQAVKTKGGELFSRFGSATLGVFKWIDGENRQDAQTKAAEYRMLARVYAVPAEGLAISREDFSPSRAERFFEQWKRLKSNPFQASAARIDALFAKNQAKIMRRAERLALFSKRCRGDDAGFCITHGDAGGNVIAKDSRYSLVDWDNPL